MSGGASGAGAGYWPGPWPGEDGGPRRLQAPHGLAGLGLRGGERVRVTGRHLLAATMIVLRDPGEVFLLRHTLFRSYLGLPTTSQVERLDPVTLRPLARSPELPGGPFWPGGLAAHANGSLYVVYGRYAHRLGVDLTVLASRELPRPHPYNSFVLLPDGCLVSKDFDRQGRRPSRLVVLEPERLTPVCEEVLMPEACVARLSADGEVVYAVGVEHALRYVWDGARGRLERDEGWEARYVTSPEQSYGWDPAIAPLAGSAHVFFMDNGHHRYIRHMRGKGCSRGPVHLVRVSVAGADDAERREVSGHARGSITNPPLCAPERGIVVGYDSSNAVMQAWRFHRAGDWEPLWRRRSFACASHMVYFPDTGELVTQDFHRLLGDSLVVLDVETGAERARVRVGSPFQGVLFPAPGFARDLYYVSFSRVARVAFEP